MPRWNCENNGKYGLICVITRKDDTQEGWIAHIFSHFIKFTTNNSPNSSTAHFHGQFQVYNWENCMFMEGENCWPILGIHSFLWHPFFGFFGTSFQILFTAFHNSISTFVLAKSEKFSVKSKILALKISSFRPPDTGHPKKKRQWPEANPPSLAVWLSTIPFVRFISNSLALSRPIFLRKQPLPHH